MLVCQINAAPARLHGRAHGAGHKELDGARGPDASCNWEHCRAKGQNVLEAELRIPYMMPCQPQDGRPE